MNYKTQKIVCLFIVFTLLLIVTNAPVESSVEADCEAALAKCLFAYTLAFGIMMAAILCWEGYNFCLQFIV